MSEDYKSVPHLPNYTISKEVQDMLSPEELRKLQATCTELTRQTWDRYAKAQRSKGRETQ